MKCCPFCAESIQDAAIKCRYCGEFLDGRPHASTTYPPPPPHAKTLPWYFRTSSIVVVFLCLPPLAIPMILWHPTMPRGWKIGLSIPIAAFSCLLIKLTITSISLIISYYRLLGPQFMP